MGTVVQLPGFKWSVELSAPTVFKLAQMVDEMREFEKVQKGNMQTPGQRLKMFKQIEAHARAIETAIEEMDQGAFISLDGTLACDVYSQEINRQAVGFEDDIGGFATYAQRIAGNLAGAAQKAAKRISDKNGGKGRKPVLGSYAGFIARIAYLVKDEGIKPGRGGAFESICSELFIAAAIPAQPEGAIKYFLSHMAEDYRQRGLCL